MTPLFGVQPLPFSGSPKSGESGEGFLLRMAETNGLGLHEFFAVLGQSGRRRVKPSDAPILARLFDCRTSDIAPLFVAHSYGQYWVQRFDFHGHQVTRSYFLDFEHPKVCPHCLTEFGYARAIWDLSFFLWCPLHQCALVGRCPACHCNLNWFRPGISKCSCGCDLGSVVSDAIVPCSAKIMATLLERYMGGQCAPRMKFPTEFDAAFGVLSTLSLDGVMRLIWILGVDYGASAGLGRGRGRRSIADATLIVEAGFRQLQALVLDISAGVSTNILPSKLIANALRRMLDDGATAGDRCFARTCLEVALRKQSKEAPQSFGEKGTQLLLPFDQPRR